MINRKAEKFPLFFPLVDGDIQIHLFIARSAFHVFFFTVRQTLHFFITCDNIVNGTKGGYFDKFGRAEIGMMNVGRK